MIIVTLKLNDAEIYIQRCNVSLKEQAVNLTISDFNRKNYAGFDWDRIEVQEIEERGN